MDPTEEAKMVLYRIGIAKDQFKWERTKMPEPDGTVAYEGVLGPVKITVISYRIKGIGLLGIPHVGMGYEGVIRTGLNVIRMPQDMAEEFFGVAESRHQ